MARHACMGALRPRWLMLAADAHMRPWRRPAADPKRVSACFGAGAVSTADGAIGTVDAVVTGHGASVVHTARRGGARGDATTAMARGGVRGARWCISW